MMVGGSFFYSDRTTECVRFVYKNVGVNFTVIPSGYWIRGDQIAKSNFAARSRFVGK